MPTDTGYSGSSRPRREYVHETDLRNVPSIRKTGVEARYDPAEENRRFVSARDADLNSPDVPRGRARVRFSTDQEPIRRPGLRAVKFKESIRPEDVTGVDYTPRRGPGVTRPRTSGSTVNEMPYEPGSMLGKVGGTLNVAGAGLGLYNMLAQFAPRLGLPIVQTPVDWVLNDVMSQNYASGGAMDPYRDYQGPRDPNTGAILA